MNKYTSDDKTAFVAAAAAARHAAAMGWSPTNTGLLVNVQGDTWSCCALGALALQHKLDSQTEEHTMRDLVLEVEDMELCETLASVPGIKHRGWASRSVANAFDRMATAEDFTRLSASDFWLLVAERFEGLAR